MEAQASADGSLQVLKQGTTQESYLHWHRGAGGVSGLGPDENHVKLLLQKLALLNSYGTELFEGQVRLCTTVVDENTLKTSRSEEGYPCDLKGSKK